MLLRNLRLPSRVYDGYADGGTERLRVSSGDRFLRLKGAHWASDHADAAFPRTGDMPWRVSGILHNVHDIEDVVTAGGLHAPAPSRKAVSRS